MDTALGEALQKLADACEQWTEDTGDCHFCTVVVDLTANVEHDVHEDWCPLGRYLAVRAAAAQAGRQSAAGQ